MMLDPRVLLRGLTIIAVLPLMLTCGVGDHGSAPQRVRLIEGFSGPESVRYDPDQDVYFVSNIAGYGSVKDSIGYIARVDAGQLDRIDIFIESGRNGAVLHAPKGLTLQGDTLWVADIDVLRGFDRRSGTPRATVDLRLHGAVLLNDVAVGPDGSVHVTDTGIIMSPQGVVYTEGQKIFSVAGPQHRVTTVAAGAQLNHPNGISWDHSRGRWMVVGFHPFVSEAYAMSPGDTARAVIARGIGRFDGVEALRDGRLLVTSWSDSSLHVIDEGRDERVIRNLWQPADLGIDTRRNRVAIPLVLQGRVEVWTIPQR